MIIIDNALADLAKNNRAIRTGIVGAGYIASHLALQITDTNKGISLAAICSRNSEKAAAAMRMAKISDYSQPTTQEEFDAAIRSGSRVIGTDPFMLCRSSEIDVVVEATGTIEYGAAVAMEAIRCGKPIILCNAELHATLGPILKWHADQAGVVFTDMDGDQPAVTMNLVRSLKTMGFKPVLCGNIKGMLDHYRTPVTQAAFAAEWGQSPKMVTSFADGSKIAFEQVVIANATGMHVGVRGMYGPTAIGDIRIENAADWFPHEAMEEGYGIVDYVIGAWPPAGIFVIARNDSPIHQKRLELYKLGKGPYYVFYTPTHLCGFETINTIARAQLFHDAAITPKGRQVAGVMAVAKADLPAGTVLDGIGGHHLYGLCENAVTMRNEGLLPLGLAEGCLLSRDVMKDEAISRHDVVLPAGRLCDRLDAEQNAMSEACVDH